jgi:hypothetical protein
METRWVTSSTIAALDHQHLAVPADQGRGLGMFGQCDGQCDEIPIILGPATWLAGLPSRVFDVFGEEGHRLHERFSVLDAQPVSELLAGKDNESSSRSLGDTTRASSPDRTVRMRFRGHRR